MIMYVLPLLVCATMQFNEHAIVTEPVRTGDPWVSRDKFLHFSVSAAITGYSYYASVKHLDMEPVTGKTVSVSLTALIGIGKELVDHKKGGLFSWKDLIWDGAGIMVGYLLFCQ